MNINSVVNTNTLRQAAGFSPSAPQTAEARTPSANQEPLASKEPSANQEPSASKQEPSANKKLSEAEKRQVEALKHRDVEVKTHEQAHLAAAGNLAQGGASFDYETGPDGKRYAVGGEVNIDTSAVAGNPQATLIKAREIQQAASAPADPSAQDRSVAAQAATMETQARAEISQQAQEKQKNSIDGNSLTIYTQIQNNSIVQQQQSSIDFFI